MSRFWNAARRQLRGRQNSRRHESRAAYQLESLEQRLLLSVTPVIATITPDTGASSTDRITNAVTLTLSGTADPSTAVQILDGTRSAASVNANASGGWTAVVSSLSEGSHSFKAAESSGLVSAAQSVTVDTTPPAAPVVNAPALTNSSRPTITGTAEANATVKVYDGTTLLGATQASSTGAWSYQPATALADGTHDFLATATDLAGNTNAAVPVTLKLRLSGDSWNGAPQFTVSLNGVQVGGTYSVASLHDNDQWEIQTVTTTAVPGPQSVVVAFVNDGNAGTHATDRNLYVDYLEVNGVRYEGEAAQNTVGYGYTTPNAAPMLANGLLTFTMVSTTVDTAAPAAPTITAPTQTVGPKPTLAGTAEANATVAVYDGSTLLGRTTASSAGSWSYTVSSALADGAHRLTATATDGAGNTGPASAAASLTVDATPPAAPTIAAPATPSYSATPGLTGTAEANSLVTVYDGTASLGTARADGSGQWSFTPTALSVGLHSITATATDGVGNVGAASAVFQVRMSSVSVTASADSWNGDPQFSLLLDGHVFGGPYTVSASRAAGALQAITVVGDFGVNGPQQATVRYVNDAGGGTAASDRNLYVAGVTVNGWAYAGAYAADDASQGVTSASVAVMRVNGSATFDTSQQFTTDWIGGTSGSWSNAANWSSGAVPTSTDHVHIAGGTATTITVGGSSTIAGLSSTASLVLSGSSFTVNGPVSNSGSLSVQSGTMLVVGSFANSGQITIGSAASILVQGNLNLTSTSDVKIEIADFDLFGTLGVTGQANIAGTLSASRPGLYTASLGRSFNVLVTGSIVGVFSSGTGLSQLNGTGLALQQVNHIIQLSVVNTTSHAYYIDPTAAAGGDGSQAHPFNSFAQLPATTGKLDATIYLKRGTTIRQELDLTSASNFIVDAYGTGNLPIIDGSNVVSATWQKDTSGWYISGVAAIQAVYANGARLQDVASASALTVGSSWWDSADQRMYVRLAADANPNSQLMEITARVAGINIVASTNFVVRNVQVQRGRGGGLVVNATDGNQPAVAPSNILIENCVATYNGSWDSTSLPGDGFLVSGIASLQTEYVTLRGNQSTWNINCAYETDYMDHLTIEDNVGQHCGNGIEFWNSVTNTVVQRNRITDINGPGTAAGWRGHGNGIWLTDTTQSVGTGGNANIKILANIFANTASSAMDIRDGTGIEVDGNVVYNAGTEMPDGSGTALSFTQYGTNPTQISFKNNIVDLGNRIFYAFKVLNGAQATLNSNLYYSENGNHLEFQIGDASWTGWTTAFTDYVQASGQDANSLNVDPQFVDPANEDFHLAATSPAASTGDPTVAVRHAIDLALYGTPRPIGAYATVKSAS